MCDKAKDEDVEITDSSTSSTYTIDFSSSAGCDGKYPFEKLMSTTLHYSAMAFGETVGPIVLYKQ